MGQTEHEELEPVFTAVSGYFSLLAEPMRLRILHAICTRELSVSEIIEQVQGTQTNVSRHLNLMHRAGVLGRRKDGQQVYYRVTDPNLTELCRTVCNTVASNLAAPAVIPQAAALFMKPSEVNT